MEGNYPLGASIDGKLDRLFDRVEVSIDQGKEAKTSADNANEKLSNLKWNTLFLVVAVVGLMYGTMSIWMQGIEMIIGTIETNNQVVD